jgi:hypothetical protein
MSFLYPERIILIHQGKELLHARLANLRQNLPGQFSRLAAANTRHFDDLSF